MQAANLNEILAPKVKEVEKKEVKSTEKEGATKTLLGGDNIEEAQIEAPQETSDPVDTDSANLEEDGDGLLDAASDDDDVLFRKD